MQSRPTDQDHVPSATPAPSPAFPPYEALVPTMPSTGNSFFKIKDWDYEAIPDKQNET